MQTFLALHVHETASPWNDRRRKPTLDHDHAGRAETYSYDDRERFANLNPNMLFINCVIDSDWFEEILKYIELLSDAKDYYKSKKLEQLFLIRDSPRYLERVYDRFTQKFKSIARCQKSQEEMKIKSKDLSQQVVELNTRLKIFIKKTKELQKYVSLSYAVSNV